MEWLWYEERISLCWRRKVNKEMINLHTEALSSFWAFKVFHTEEKGRAQEEAISGFLAEILIFCFNLLMLCSLLFKIN